jgi:hypothetical protein
VSFLIFGFGFTVLKIYNSHHGGDEMLLPLPEKTLPVQMDLIIQTP